MGNAGEDKAVSLLEKDGYAVIARNYRSKRGEIDIIALDGRCIVFIEVKNWHVYPVDDLAYAIGPEKRRRIIATSKQFLSESTDYADYDVRYDILFLVDRDNDAKHLYNVFTESGAVW